MFPIRQARDFQPSRGRIENPPLLSLLTSMIDEISSVKSSERKSLGLNVVAFGVSSANPLIFAHTFGLSLNEHEQKRSLNFCADS